MLDNTSKFNELYQRFEARLKKIAGVSDKTDIYGVINLAGERNVIVEKNKRIINDLVALRNVLFHCDRKKYIKMNDIALESVENLLDLLDNPPKVIDRFKADVYRVDLNDRVDEVVFRMKEKNYTHIPVYDDDKFVGVFTETSLLDWLAGNIKNGEADFRKTQMKDINKQYLHTQNNGYKFVAPSFNVFEVQSEFEKAINDKKRLGVIFITDSGKQDGKIVGIITAWDLPKIKNL